MRLRVYQNTQFQSQNSFFLEMGLGPSPDPFTCGPRSSPSTKPLDPHLRPQNWSEIYACAVKSQDEWRRRVSKIAGDAPSLTDYITLQCSRPPYVFDIMWSLKVVIRVYIVNAWKRLNSRGFRPLPNWGRAPFPGVDAYGHGRRRYFMHERL